MARPRVGIIGGSGLYSLGAGEPAEVESDWGPATLTHHRWGTQDIFFLARDGADHAVPPHRINHRAHLAVLRAAHVDYALAVNNVGSLRRDIRPGRWLVPDDFLDGMGGAGPTFHEEEAAHADLSEPYCPHARSALLHASGPQAVARGVYAGTRGPRFETAAEVRGLAQLGGDVVGMTGVPEAALAREAGLCYASLCWVGNYATGLQRAVHARAIVQGLAKRRATVLRILRDASKLLPERKRCHCAGKLAEAAVGEGARRR